MGKTKGIHSNSKNKSDEKIQQPTFKFCDDVSMLDKPINSISIM